MKTRIAFVALVLAFVCHSGAYAQLFSKKKYTGKVVLNNGDTVAGNILFKDKAPFYKKITLEDPDTKEIRYFDLTNASSFILDDDVFYNKETKEGERTFMVKLTDGQVSLYMYKAVGPKGNELNNIYLEKQNGDGLLVPDSKTWDFKTHVSKFFDDYPTLSKKIQAEEYKAFEIFTIAQVYNDWVKPNVY